MNILCLVQSISGLIPKSALSAVQAAIELKNSWKLSKIILLVVGNKDLAEQLASTPVDEVIYCEDPRLTKYFAPEWSDFIYDVMNQKSADNFITISSSIGKDFCPRLAAKLDAGQASDIVAVNSDGTLRRPMYAGDVIADVSIESIKKVITVRASAFNPPSPGGSPTISSISSNFSDSSLGNVISVDMVKAERPELTDARIVVSGGRAVGSAENFEKIIFPLADALGAAVGASRAAVDSGYAPNDWQVGQTGKIVAPDLYISAGISGAIQHLAGMKDSKVIVAVNKDPEAPIFEIADYSLVADLFTAVPEMTAIIKGSK